LIHKSYKTYIDCYCRPISSKIKLQYFRFYSKIHSIPISTKIRVMKALVWPVKAVKAGHSERIKIHVLMPLRWKGWEKILRVSWTAKQTN